MKKLKLTLACLFFLLAGVVIGGYFFARSQPRSLLSLDHCQDCLSAKDLSGLIVSAGIQRLPGLVPDVVLETDKTVVIKNPFVHGDVDYVILPKKDIKNIGELSANDAPYLVDAYLVARRLIEEKKLSYYRFYTNGPDRQEITYLHFHLIGK
jgi:diadenosine tetraphosphate (Ap4A) HIT family hydrolase